MDTPNLSLAVDGGVARLALARPEARNALGLDDIEALLHTLEELDGREDVRVVLLEGKGKTFCVGVDIKQAAANMMSEGGIPPADELRAVADLGARMLATLDQLSAVTVASVHGHAIGGAFLLLAACDLRVAAEDTVFAIPEVNLGMPFTWNGVPMVIRELGPSRARELVLTGRRFGPADLAGTGFLTHTVPAAERAQRTDELVGSLAAKPPLALRQIKLQFTQALTPEAVATHTSDPDLFATAVHDPGFLPAAMAYLQRLSGRDRPR